MPSCLLQAYTSHGPTVLMPTWFCSRKVLEDVGGFDEGGKVASLFLDSLGTAIWGCFVKGVILKLYYDVAL